MYEIIKKPGLFTGRHYLEYDQYFLVITWLVKYQNGILISIIMVKFHAIPYEGGEDRNFLLRSSVLFLYYSCLYTRVSAEHRG